LLDSGGMAYLQSLWPDRFRHRKRVTPVAFPAAAYNRHGAVSSARRGMSRYGKAGMVYNPPIKHRGNYHEIPDTRLTIGRLRHSTDGRTDKARTDHQPQDLPANGRLGQVHKIPIY